MPLPTNCALEYGILKTRLMWEIFLWRLLEIWYLLLCVVKPILTWCPIPFLDSKSLIQACERLYVCITVLAVFCSRFVSCSACLFNHAASFRIYNNCPSSGLFESGQSIDVTNLVKFGSTMISASVTSIMSWESVLTVGELTFNSSDPRHSVSERTWGLVSKLLSTTGFKPVVDINVYEWSIGEEIGGKSLTVLFWKNKLILEVVLEDDDFIKYCIFLYIILYGS